MGRIEELAERYGRHIATAWQKTVAGAQRVIMVVYDNDLERTLRARKLIFETATTDAGHDWHDVDITNAFADWLGADEYRDAYFESPEDLEMKLQTGLEEYVAARIRGVLQKDGVSETSVVAILGAGTLYGFARVSQVVKLVEADIRGRLLFFFPGQYESNNYRLLDARDGWNYLAVPITQHSTGGSS